MNTKLERLSQMLKRHWRTWVEPFKNEETGLEEPIERQELIEIELTDEERQLIKEITDDIESLSDEDLARFQLEVSFYDVRIIDKAYLERVRRGDKEYAEFIHDVPTLMALYEKGNRWAAYALYQKYLWGDEAQGIFINRTRAKHYYDFSGDILYKDKWEDTEEPGEENPRTYEYVITGAAGSLDGVQNLIERLCQRFGIPENEEGGLGMYVPQEIVMKVLVGSDSKYYRGNILHMERTAPDRLVITSESDNGEPLLYALRQCFENIEIKLNVVD